MNCKQRTSGIALMDLIIGLAISLLVGAAGLQLIVATYNARTDVSGQNFVNALCRVQIDTIADTLRDAQIGPSLCAFSAASKSDVTVYTDSSGDSVRLYLNTTVSPYQLMRVRTTAGVAGTAAAIGTGVISLQFTYYPAGSWSTTLSPNYPSTSELPTIGAVGITVQMTVNGFTSSLTSLVRMRNSPYVAPSP